MKIFLVLLLPLSFALIGCPETKDTKTAGKHGPPPVSEASADADFQGFVNRLRKAAAARDVNTLAGMMTTDFGYRLTPEGSGEGVFQFWQENNLWSELNAVLTEQFVQKGEFMVSPPQFASETTEYEGYRAGIRRVNGSWKFVYFVNG